MLGHTVTPFVGVWIETTIIKQDKKATHVTPFVGVWIETAPTIGETDTARHTLRGCVD